MGRKRKSDEEISIPLCGACKKNPLELLVAALAYECDKCRKDIFVSGCFYGCPPCDYALCGSCYVDQSAALEEQKDRAEKYAKYIVPEGTIHPEIWAICEEWDLDDRLARSLNEEMQKRFDTWESDMQKIKMEMKFAKGARGGLMFSKIKQMKEGTFIGKMPPPPEVARFIKKYKLNDDAKDRFSDFLNARKHDGLDWQKDLWETEQRCMGANNPSMVVLTMIVNIQQGKPLPPLKPIKQTDYVKRYDEAHGHRDRERSRSNAERRQRHRSPDDNASRRAKGRDADYSRGDDRQDGYRQGEGGKGGRSGRGGRDDEFEDDRQDGYRQGEGGRGGRSGRGGRDDFHDFENFGGDDRRGGRDRREDRSLMPRDDDRQDGYGQGHRRHSDRGGRDDGYRRGDRGDRDRGHGDRDRDDRPERVFEEFADTGNIGALNFNMYVAD